MGTILIDSPARELVPACLILSELLSGFNDSNKYDMYGHFIDEIDNYFNVGRASLFARARSDSQFILSPSYSVLRTPAITFRAKINNIPLIVYHSEQFVPPYYYEDKFSLSEFERYNSAVSAHLVWGEYFRDKLISIGVPSHKIHIVGNIKNEVAIYAAEQEGGVVRSRNASFDYLFVSSFSLAEMSDQEFAIYRLQYKLPSTIDERPNAFNCREGMIDFIELLAKALPEKNILVRRHPGESSQGYSRLTQIPNVKFSEMGPFVSDARRARLVLLQDSTSVFELETLGIDWISVDFHRSEAMYLVEPKELFRRHPSQAVLAALLDDEYRHLLGRREVMKYDLEYFLGPVDKAVSRRIAEVIHKVSASPPTKRWYLKDIADVLILIGKSAVCIALKFRVLRRLPFLTQVTRRLKANQKFREMAEHGFSDSNLTQSWEIAKKWKKL